jgi:hypothetical protein
MTDSADVTFYEFVIVTWTPEEERIRKVRSTGIQSSLRAVCPTLLNHATFMPGKMPVIFTLRASCLHKASN